MAISKKVTFEGNKYSLGTIERVAAATAAEGGVQFKGFQRQVLRQTVFTTTKTLTVGESGALVLFDKDEASAITLPAITSADLGVNYTFLETVASNNDRTVDTAYNNDYYIGSLMMLPSAVWAASTAQDDAAFNTIAGSTDTQITWDGNLANGMGGVGSQVTLTAILTGNTAAGGGSKFVWSVTGNVFTFDPDSTGVAVFT